MKHGKWGVTSNYICERYLYAVYRLIDVNAVDHSGNREYASNYLINKAEAEAIAAEMNAKEAENEKHINRSE